MDSLLKEKPYVDCGEVPSAPRQFKSETNRYVVGLFKANKVRYARPGKMTTVDWRWAAEKGFWDADHKRWNEENGGWNAYLEQRDARCAKRMVQPRRPKLRSLDGIMTFNTSKAPLFKKRNCFLKHIKIKALQHCMVNQRRRQIKVSAFAESMSTVFDLESPLLQCMMSRGWHHSVVRRYWTFGHDKDSVACIFDWLPDSLKAKIETTLNLLQTCTQRISTRLHSANRWRGIQRFSTTASQVKDPTSTPFQLEPDQAALWEEERRLGIVEVQYDPVTQYRKHVSVNTCAAYMMNMSKQEMLTRFADYQLPLATSEIDALRIFCVDLHSSFRDCTSICYRRIIPCGRAVAAMLICSTQQKVFTAAGQISKIRGYDRVLSAKEYDEALRRAPESCPLAMTGDSRSGQQLLDDAEADYGVTIQSLAQSEEGRSLFDGLLTRMEGLLGTLRRRSVEMGCCTDIEDSFQASSAQKERSVVIDRPLAYQINSYRFDAENQAVSLLTRLWSNEAVRRLWNVGHPAQFLLHVFNAIPPPLVSAIGKASIVLQKAKQRSVQPRTVLDSLMQAPDDSVKSADENEQKVEDEDLIWDEDQSRGFLRIDWDTRTQCRKYVCANATLASFFAMHKEELLARFANHEMPGFESEVDFLCYFVFKLCTELQDESCQYQRLLVKSVTGVRAVLVCLSTTKNFNHLGQVYQVKNHLRVIQPKEYDAALLRTPALCPLAMLGDMRSGRELLIAADADARRTVGALAATRHGREALDLLAARLESVVSNWA